MNGPEVPETMILGKDENHCIVPISAARVNLNYYMYAYGYGLNIYPYSIYSKVNKKLQIIIQQSDKKW